MKISSNITTTFDITNLTEEDYNLLIRSLTYFMASADWQSKESYGRLKQILAAMRDAK